MEYQMTRDNNPAATKTGPHFAVMPGSQILFERLPFYKTTQESHQHINKQKNF